MSAHVLQGDCRELMAAMDANSVDAIVTDPPYELGFMGRAWDHSGIAYDDAVWREALRVLKPGGHLLAFGHSRTYHRLACAIEDAGFDIRDQLMWLYGSGFPKGSLVEGWAPALKPAHEPICMARKKFRGSVASCIVAHGTGALNIDACRNPTNGETARGSGRPKIGTSTFGDFNGNGGNVTPESGRWPANVLHDGSDDVLVGFPDAPARDGARKGDSMGYSAKGAAVARVPAAVRRDTGSAARFFYCAKASRADRGPENTHPTVKPTTLMRWLCRLVTPPGGLILDPFAGSGSTGKAAVLEDFRFVGCELTPEYVPIAIARIAVAKEAA